MAEEVVETEVVEEVVEETPATEEVVEEEANGDSDINYVAEIRAEIERVQKERDEALAELDRVKQDNSGTSQEAQKYAAELKEIWASFKGKGEQVPTREVSPASNVNNGTAPESQAERNKRLWELFN